MQRVVAGNVDDDQVIAAAVAPRADLIGSGDRNHLPPLGHLEGIDIIDTPQALQRIAPASNNAFSALAQV